MSIVAIMRYSVLVEQLCTVYEIIFSFWMKDRY